MKKLNHFLHFAWEDFAKEKRFLCTGTKPWKDYATSSILGTQIDTVIIHDGTHYGDDSNTNNLYEKITFKVPKELEIPVNTEVRPKGVVATVYGDYHNMLSAKAEDIVVVK